MQMSEKPLYEIHEYLETIIAPNSFTFVFLYYNKYMLNRHEAREKLVFTIYQHLLLHKDLQACFDNSFEEEEYDAFTAGIRDDLIENEEKYIEEIGKHLVKWTFDRLNLVEQAILLETVSELHRNINDKAVVIDEAIILAKTYCDEDSYKYINGVLDNICNSSLSAVC